MAGRLLGIGLLLLATTASEGAGESNVSSAASPPVVTGPAGSATAQKVVLVTGTGTDENSAIKNALSRAIEEAVGVVVDAQTVVENEKLITEKILTYSDGIVSTYAPIRGWREGTLVNVKIQATVEMRALVERLQANRITVTDVSGESLFATAVTAGKRATDARELLLNALKDFPVNLMAAEVSGQPQIVKSEGDDAIIGYVVKLGIDRQKYQAFATRFTTVLQQTGHTGIRRLLVAQDEPAEQVKLAGAIGLKLPGAFSPPLVRRKPGEPWRLCINTASDSADRRTTRYPPKSRRFSRSCR